MNKLTLDVEKLRVETFATSQGDRVPLLDDPYPTIFCSPGVTCGTCPPPVV